MLDSENKTWFKKFSQSCFVAFQMTFLLWRNDVFSTLKKQAKKIKFGYQAFNELL